MANDPKETTEVDKCYVCGNPLDPTQPTWYRPRGVALKKGDTKSTTIKTCGPCGDAAQNKDPRSAKNMTQVVKAN